MNPKIVKFTPIKGSGNILGFCGLQVMVSLNGKMIPMVLKAKVARNSQTGHVFISIHQEAYQKPDGTTGYSNLANFPQELYKEFNEAAAQAWKDFCTANGGVATEQSTSTPGNGGANSSEFYPHGMARNIQANQPPVNQPQVHKQQRQYKEQLDEELPF